MNKPKYNSKIEKKTLQETITKLNLIVKEILYNHNQEEDKAIEKKQRLQFTNDKKNLFGDLPDAFIDKITHKFFLRLTAEKLENQAKALVV